VFLTARRPLLIALLVAGAFFMENLDGTVIATAVPRMARSFGVSPVDLNIGITAYLLALAVFIPISGWLADRFGARTIFGSAIAIFTGSSILKDIAKFARGLSQVQRRALGIRRTRQGKYPAPTQPTFCRLLQRVDARKVKEVILAIQEQVRGPAPKDQLIVLDGKEPKHGSGASVLTAVSIPSQYYLASALVDQKTNSDSRGARVI